MKKIILIVLVLLLVIFAIYRYNSNHKVILLNLLIGQDSIQPGNLVYRVTFLNVLPIGRAYITPLKAEQYKGIKTYHLQARAIASYHYAKFFKASTTLDSYVDTVSNNPVFFRQVTHITGKPDIAKEVNYDQKNGLMTINGVSRTILPNTQDPLSAVFNLRKMDLEKICNFEMNINTNQKNYVLAGTVIPKDISINKKIYRAYVVKGTVRRRDKNNPYHRSKITMVMLKDAENTPISIKVFASGALINAKLISIE